MRRRSFITILGGAATWPLTVRAQQPSARRVGVLSPLAPSAAASPSFEIFRKTLLDHGYVEGRSISFEYRWADGTLPAHATFALGTMCSGRSSTMISAVPSTKRMVVSEPCRVIEDTLSRLMSVVS
jgi:hypothetical protein